MGTRFFVEFDTIDPRNNPVDASKLWTVGIPEWLYRIHQNKGREANLARIILVEQVLQGGIEQIRRGWSRPGKEDNCYAYIGRPKRDYPSFQIDLPAPPGRCFVVFILEDGTIDDWTWRKIVEEKGEFTHPDSVKGDLIWPPQKT